MLRLRLTNSDSLMGTLCSLIESNSCGIVYNDDLEDNFLTILIRLLNDDEHLGRMKDNALKTYNRLFDHDKLSSTL